MGTALTKAEQSREVAVVRREVARACDQEGVIGRGETVVLACSGGADSTAMLDACIRLAPPRQWVLHVVHVDHGLRPQSDLDAAAIEQRCRDKGIDFTRAELQLVAGTGIQARAREARYDALRQIAGKIGADVIATAHTADDQAETVLMRALSQATPKSLTGISARENDLARPMLGLWREQLRAYCATLDLAFVDDPANSDPRYTRSRVRHELLPALETVFPAAKRRLVALAQGQRQSDRWHQNSRRQG